MVNFQQRFIPTCVGKTLCCLSWSVFLRFIPTCVGKTPAPRYHPPAGPVHPHVCGENSTTLQTRRLPFRFIPTCVGKTRSGGGISCAWAVHPHVCGENGLAGMTITRLLPVHPHVCGENFVVEFCGKALGRFIPTCVGKTSRARATRRGRIGSSPRVWGKREINKFCPFVKRFIPTCVGKTARF